LLKNPESKIDGIFWLMKKLAELKYDIKSVDLPDSLDEKARKCVLEQYQELKRTAP
jgi:hypothetical protein